MKRTQDKPTLHASITWRSFMTPALMTFFHVPSVQPAELKSALESASYTIAKADIAIRESDRLLLEIDAQLNVSKSMLK